MAVVERQFWAHSHTDSWLDARPNPDDDDFRSIRRWLARCLAPAAAAGGLPDVEKGEPYIFIEPIEGTFQRPGITITPITVGTWRRQGARSHNWFVEHSLAIASYGRDRKETLELGQKVWRLLNDGGCGYPPYRIPLWSFALQTRLARFLSVLPDSLAMALEQSNDQDLWARPIELRVQSPRTRPARTVPTIADVGTTTAVS